MRVNLKNTKSFGCVKIPPIVIVQKLIIIDIFTLKFEEVHTFHSISFTYHGMMN